jgi:hypothetical protein
MKMKPRRMTTKMVEIKWRVLAWMVAEKPAWG